MVENKRGVFFSLDAVLALGLIIAVVGGLGFYYSIAPEMDYRDKHSEAEDIMSFISNSKADEIDGIDGYTNETRTGSTVLELIGSHWAAGETQAVEDITAAVIDQNTRRCWELIFPDGTSVGNCEDEGDTVSIASRMASGYETGKMPHGYVARGHLTDAESRLENSYIFFGGYVGDGNITQDIELENMKEVQGATMELDAGGNFTLFINDEEAGEYVPEKGDLRADRWEIDQDHLDSFEEGTNEIRLNFTGTNRSISGGSLHVEYSLTDVYHRPGEPGTKTYSFPGIEGIINLYDGLEVPGTLENIEVDLKYNSSADLFLNLGNVTVYESGWEDVEGIEDILDKGGLDHEDLSNGTVPIRLGVKDLRDLRGIDADPDAVATTDVSGNMQARLHDSEYHNKWEAAEAATNLFLDVFENATQARAGLTGFDSGLYSYYPVTNDTQALKNELEQWETGGPTCIGCGILMSINSLITREMPPYRDYRTVVGKESEWSVSEEYEDGWMELDFNDSEWSKERAPVGPGGEIDPSEEYYLRTTFEYFPVEFRQPFLELDQDGDVEVYLNGKKIHSSRENTQNNWNEVVGRWDNVSGMWHPSDNRYTTGNRSWYFGIEEEGHYETNKIENGTIVSPWVENTGEKKLEFEHWLDKGSQHTATVDVDYGQGWETLMDFEETDGNWEKISIDLSNNDEVRARFRFDSIEEVEDQYEGWYVDNVSLGGFTSNLLDKEIMEDEENVLAVLFEPEDEGSSFDAEISASEYRYRSMVVLSGGNSNQPTNMEEAIYHESLDNSRDHTIEAACRAYKNHDITVHAVAFVEEDEEEAIEELQEAAECGGGEFYRVDPDELEEVYERIAHDILEATMEEQRVIPERRVEDRLYKESNINITYSHKIEPLKHGEVPLTISSDSFGGEVESPKEGQFWVGEAARVLEAHVTTYPSRFWTSVVNISNSEVDENIYNLSEYGEDYSRLGDPHNIAIPPKYISHGENTITVDTSSEAGNFTGGSPDSRVIYTVAVNGSVGYGDVFPKYEGGERTVELETGEKYQLGVGNTSDAWDPEEDALDDLVDRLLDKLDVDNSGKINLRISEGNIAVDETKLGEVPYLWGPGKFTLKIW